MRRWPGRTQELLALAVIERIRCPTALSTSFTVRCPDFLQVADFYLIAHALADGHVVVTHEVPTNSVKRIKIPNVCIGLGIRFITPHEMLRRERARFVRGRGEM